MIEIDAIPEYLIRWIPPCFKLKPNHFYWKNGELGLLSIPNLVTLGVFSHSDNFSNLEELLQYNSYKYKRMEDFQGIVLEDDCGAFFELDVASIARPYTLFSPEVLLNEVRAIAGETDVCFLVSSLSYKNLHT